VYSSDVPDRTDFAAPRIARDLAGLDTWWRAQDPTRTPRFDLADFASCDSEFGRLDITTVALPNGADSYNATDRSGLLSQLRADIARQVGVSVGKAYLVYVDFPVPVVGGICGLTRPGPTFPSLSNGTAFVFVQPNVAGCTTGGFGSGAGWPAQVAAHELVHLFTGGTLQGAPNACPDDPSHACNPSIDVLAVRPNISYSSLSQAQLDGGRDDYYGHGVLNRWDARNSLWLVHLDAPQYVVAVGQPAGGHVVSALPGVQCPPRCNPAWDAGATVQLSASPDPGFAFATWAGDCQGSYAVCTVTADAEKFVLPVFLPLQQLEVRVKGPGSVYNDRNFCDDRCVWERMQGSSAEFVAEPDRGAVFVGWKGCRSTRKHCSAVVKRHLIVVARFAKR
jgi:Divergent InlB B-repeat domain